MNILCFSFFLPAQKNEMEKSPCKGNVRITVCFFFFNYFYYYFFFSWSRKENEIKALAMVDTGVLLVLLFIWQGLKS